MDGMNQVAEGMPPGWRRTVAPGWGLNGKELHGLGSSTGVPMYCWCVTKADLLFLRADIKRAVANKEILPSERDSFRLNDNIVGPNMYTCNDKYLKPLTNRAGSMSWALLRNPEGCRCDVFVTHAWVEGIYELIDKVVSCWPRYKKACYICVLSNPQNLDIDHLLQKPSASPFAVCLDSASHMLVIPNQTASIYSRLWCVYEAYRAYKHDKIILTASAPIRWKMFACLVFQGSVAMITLCLVMVNNPCLFNLLDGDSILETRVPLESTMAWLLILMKVGQPFLHGTSCKDKRRRSEQVIDDCVTRTFTRRVRASAAWLFTYPLGFVANILALSYTCLLMAYGVHNVFVAPCHQSFIMDSASSNLFLFRVVVHGSFVALCCFAAEADRVQAINAHHEACMLERNFISVRHATCSSPADKERIWQEVDTYLAQVDEAVNVLISAGMSTPALREAASCGTNMSSAAHLGFSSFAMIAGSELLEVLRLVLTPWDAPYVPWLVAKLILICIQVVSFWRASSDRRAFAVAVSLKVTLIFAVALGHVVWLDVSWYGFAVVIEPALYLTLSFYGMARICRIPCVGPFIAAFLGPGGLFPCQASNAFRTTVVQEARDGCSKVDRAAGREYGSGNWTDGEDVGGQAGDTRVLVLEDGDGEVGGEKHGDEERSDDDRVDAASAKTRFKEFSL